MPDQHSSNSTDRAGWGERIKAGSRSSEIYALVREGIMSGQWLPGDRIDDKELAETLGVSRISVREALSKFHESRIVERFHWKGFFLRKMTEKDIASIVEVRIALEEIAIRNTISNADDDFYDELERSILLAEEAVESGDHAEYIKRSFQFHSSIYEASENTWIASISENLIVPVNLLRNLSLVSRFEPVARSALADHRRILKHMRRKDVESSIQELHAHMHAFYENAIAGCHMASAASADGSSESQE